MSENTQPRGPLFPPPREETPLPPPPGATSGPEKASDQPAFNLTLAVQLERVVNDVFAKRYGERAMPFMLARDLTHLERDLIGNLVTVLAKRSST